MECTNLKTGMLFVLVETSSPGWNWTVATLVTYIPFMLDFLEYFKIRIKDTHILDTATLLSLRELSITPNVRMIQPSDILCGGTHHSWSQKIEKYQYWTVYTLEGKWPSMMKNWCVSRVLCGYSLFGVGYPRFIYLFWNA